MRGLVVGCAILLTGLVGCGTGDGTAADSPPVASGRAARADEVAAHVTQTVSLRAGWNGIAFQGFPLLTLSASSSVPGLVTWDGSAYQLISPTTAQVNAGGGANRGFWAFATEATSLSYSATDVSGTAFDLKSGWNLIGFPARQLTSGASLVTRSGGQVVPIGSVLLTEFQRINEDGTFTPVDMARGGSITPGRPYWVFAVSAVNLSWGVVPAGSPTPTPSPTASTSPTPLTSPTPTSSPTPGTSPTPAASPSPGQQVGAPPNGRYNAHKISLGDLIFLGYLDISGSTYRGLDPDGSPAFHPYTVDGGGNINLTAGLVGLPTGWTVTGTQYKGIVNGKPLIVVSYQTSGGTADIIDCVLE